VGAVAAAVSAAVSAPLTNADPGLSDQERQFVAAASRQGLYNNDGPAAEVSVGYSVCNYVANGYTPELATQTLTNKSGMSSEGATTFVATALVYLCPQFKYLHWNDTASPHAGDGE
jgi:Protein of unknown function (DUF732)